MPKVLTFGITHRDPVFWEKSPFFAVYEEGGQFLGMAWKNRQTRFWEFDDRLRRNIPSLKDVDCVMSELIAKDKIAAAYELDHPTTTAH